MSLLVFAKLILPYRPVRHSHKGDWTPSFIFCKKEMVNLPQELWHIDFDVFNFTIG